MNAGAGGGTARGIDAAMDAGRNAGSRAGPEPAVGAGMDAGRAAGAESGVQPSPQAVPPAVSFELQIALERARQFEGWLQRRGAPASPASPASRGRRREVTPDHLAVERLLLAIVETAGVIAAAADAAGDRHVRCDLEWRVLERLARYRGYVGISDIAWRLGLHRMQAWRIVRRLAGPGLVELWQAPGDRRVLHVGITASGRAAVAGALARRRSWLIDTFPGFRAAAMQGTEQAVRAVASRLVHGYRAPLL